MARVSLRLLYSLLVYAALNDGAIHSGHASYYARGVMEQVARNREMTRVDCMVSSPRYPLGTWVWVWGANTNTLLHCRVTDVSADIDTSGRRSHESDRERHLRLGWELELGWTEAQRLCSVPAMREPPKGCPILVVRL